MNWLDEQRVRFERTDASTIAVVVDGQRTSPIDLRPVFPIRAPLRMVEICTMSASKTRVLGIIRNVHEWAPSQRTIVADALRGADVRPRLARILSILDCGDTLQWHIELSDGSQMTVETRTERDEIVAEVDSSHWQVETLNGLSLILDIDALDDADCEKLWNRL